MSEYTKCIDCTVRERCIRGEVDCYKQQESSEGYDDFYLNVFGWQKIYEEEKAYEKRYHQLSK